MRKKTEKPEQERTIRLRVGTAHFVSLRCAANYYRSQGYADGYYTAQQKIADGEIFIGPPTLKPGEELALIDERTRYAILEPI